MSNHETRNIKEDQSCESGNQSAFDQKQRQKSEKRKQKEYKVMFFK
jgi:hypothetical protein